MKKLRITVKKIAHYDDLIEQYENPLEHACSMELGQPFICNGWEKPEGFCSSAWDTVSAFVMALAHGGENFYDGWMKTVILFENPRKERLSIDFLKKIRICKIQHLRRIS